MAKARRRKGSSFESSIAKSVFLYGDPNCLKAALLSEMQSSFTALVNRDIRLLHGRRDISMQLVKNDHKDSGIRKLEKDCRREGISSAFQQNAFDYAVTHLSNYFNDIRLDMYAERQSIFTQSKVLFAMSLSGKSKKVMEDSMRSISKKEDDFYHNCAETLSGMPDAEFRWEMALFNDSFLENSAQRRVPAVRSAEIPLDSRLMKLEKSENIKAPYVIEITDPFHKGCRFSVPLNTSRHSLHKNESNKMAGTVKASIRNGVLKVAWAYTRTVGQPKTKDTRGVDAGILDALYCSDGNSYGSMKEVIDFYKNTVEPSFAGLSALRNKKEAIKHYLHTHKNLPDGVGRSLIKKIDKLDQMMQKMNAPYRRNRHYRAMLDKEVSDAVKGYMGSISRETLTVIEKLDIKEFEKSRRVNGMFSTFARGALQQKLISSLNWHGYDFVEVEPAFTSQICPVCGNLDKANRQEKVFHCTCCGHHDDADHTASINIRDRADDKEVQELCEKYRYKKQELHEKLKELYCVRNTEYLKKQNLPAGAGAAAPDGVPVPA